jgi:hypothetical protein
MKRVAVFFYSPVPKPGFTAVPVGGDLVGYVRGALTPKGRDLVDALDGAHDERLTFGEVVMNSHYVKGRRKAEREDI